MIAKHNFELNKDMIYLIETLKVEGYWSSKNFTITLQNKNIPLLNNIERIVNNLGIKISKRTLVKIELENNTKKEDIKILEDQKEIKFHIEKSPFDNKKVKAVTNLPYKKEYNLKLIFKNKKNTINIKLDKKYAKIKSNIPCWVYGDLRFPTKKLLIFLEDYCGDKKYFHLEEFLRNSNEKIVMSAFSALIDCEGSLDNYGLYRRLRIRMRNQNYLEQWSELLKKHGVGCKFNKNKIEYELSITGWEDFDKLIKLGLELHHSKKKEKLKNIMKNFKRNQISRNSYKDFYLKKLKEINKKITAKEFSEYINKGKRVTSHYLLKLEKNGLIGCDKNSWPYLYFIST